MQLLIWDTRHDGLPCLGCTLNLVNGRLWFTSEKRYLPGEIAEFKIRMGWKRRITFKMRVITAGISLTNDNDYAGEFVEIDPTDFQELRSVLIGYQSDCCCTDVTGVSPRRAELLCLAD
jgi:hypothetical protein